MDQDNRSNSRETFTQEDGRNFHSGSEADDSGAEHQKMDAPINNPIVIPDPHREEIAADSDLTSDIEPDVPYLDLVHSRISSMEELNLQKFQKLESLCLRQNLITSIAEVSVLPEETMEELDFYDNRINHISSQVGKLKNLKTLDLSFNKIRNIKNLEALTKLENLYFVQNKIREIKNVECLSSLKNLELGGNRIEHIDECVSAVPSLEELWLGKNKIHKLENLQGLTNLRVLSIQSNRITKLEGLDNLVNLEELYISHNGIEKIENLDNNLNLKVVDVSSNKISHLENLKHLSKLTDFWCSSNQISDFAEVERELRHLAELDTVYLEGNPLQTQNPTAYRRKMMLHLGPSVAKIDATYVNS